MTNLLINIDEELHTKFKLYCVSFHISMKDKLIEMIKEVVQDGS